MTYRILIPILACCVGVAVAMITGGVPLMGIESVSGVKYHWWWIGFSAFISTFAATYEFSAASSVDFRKGPHYPTLLLLLVMLIPVLVVYIGLSAEFMAVLMTRYDGPLGGFFAEPEALDSQDRFLFCRSIFYAGTLLPLIVIVATSLIRRCKRESPSEVETLDV